MIQSIIGQGTFGKVFFLLQKNDFSPYAIKEINQKKNEF